MRNLPRVLPLQIDFANVSGLRRIAIALYSSNKQCQSRHSRHLIEHCTIILNHIERHEYTFSGIQIRPHPVRSWFVLIRFWGLGVLFNKSEAPLDLREDFVHSIGGDVTEGARHTEGHKEQQETTHWYVVGPDY